MMQCQNLARLIIDFDLEHASHDWRRHDPNQFSGSVVNSGQRKNRPLRIISRSLSCEFNRRQGRQACAARFFARCFVPPEPIQNGSHDLVLRRGMAAARGKIDLDREAGSQPCVEQSGPFRYQTMSLEFR